ERGRIFQAANRYAASQLARHKQYAEWTGLTGLATSLQQLEEKLGGLRHEACLLSVGWGGGMLSKVSVADTADPSYRSLAKRVAFYQKALQTGLPFPKTRRVVFQDGKPSTLAGWVLLEVTES